MLGADGLSAREQDGPLDGIFKFSDISLPGASQKNGQGSLSNFWDRQSVSYCGGTYEVARQDRDIAGAFAQRRKRNGEHIQPIVEVFAKPSLFDFLPERPIGRGDHANVDLNRFTPADTIHFTFLQDPQQLRL